MADNVTANAASGGATFRAYQESGGNEHPGMVVEYVTTLSAGANVLQPVQLTTGLPVQPQTGSTWAVTQSGTWTVNQGGSNWSMNTAQFGGSNVVTGTGAGGAGIPRVTVSNDSNVLATQSGTWTVQQGGSNWSANVAQFGGNNVVTGTGAGGAGIPRVTVSNDSNILATQSGTWTVQQGGSNWSVNAAQFGGNNVVTGTGAGGLGIPRVTVSNDSNILATQSGTWTVNQGGTWSVQQSGSNWSSNVAQFGGNAVVTGTGASGVGIPRVTVSNDSNVLATQSGTWTVQQGGSNWTVNVAQIAGTAASVNAGTVDNGTLRTTLADGNGATSYSYIAAAAANQDAVNVSASAGTLYDLEVYNTVATVRYLKLYNKATAPTSADTPWRRYMIPANGGFNLAFPKGLAFGTGLGHRITTGVADNDTGAVTANDVLVNLGYK